MDILDKKNKYNSLYDLYGVLLTPKQQEYYTSYYFDDLSLSEIASIHNISRNAVFDQLNKIYELLYYYESKLNLRAKTEKINDIISCYEKSNNIEVKNIINELKDME